MSGFPIRLSQRIAPGWSPSIRFPTTSSAPCVELGDEARDLGEVVREVGVDHHDVVAARSREAREIGVAVAPFRLVHDPRTGRRRERPAAVVRAVVDDDHLRREAAPASTGRAA